MLEQLLQSILAQMQQPKADMEKNLRALLSEMSSRLNLVSQEELERQRVLLEQAQKNIQALNQHIDELNQKIDALK